MNPFKPLFVFAGILALGVSWGITPVHAAEERKLGQFTYSREKITVTQPGTGKKIALKPEDGKQLLAQLTQASTQVTAATLNQIQPFGSNKKGNKTTETRYSGKLLRVKGDKRVWFVRTDTKQRVYFDGTDASLKFFFLHIDPSAEAVLAANERYEAAKKKAEEKYAKELQTNASDGSASLVLSPEKNTYKTGETIIVPYVLSYSGPETEFLVVDTSGYEDTHKYDALGTSLMKLGSNTYQSPNLPTGSFAGVQLYKDGNYVVQGYVFTCKNVEAFTKRTNCGSSDPNDPNWPTLLQRSEVETMDAQGLALQKAKTSVVVMP